MNQDVYTKFAAALDARLQKRAADKERLEKEAAAGRVLQRLAASLNPRVKNPTLLKWLRPFIKTKTVRTGIHGSPEQVDEILRRVYREAGMPAGAGSASAISGGSSIGAAGDLAAAISRGAPYKDVTKSRLSGARLLGAAGIAGGAGAAARALSGSHAPAAPKRDPFALFIERLAQDPRTRNALIAAAVGGLGTAALSGGSAGSRALSGLAGAAVAGGATYAAPTIIDSLKQLRKKYESA